MSGYEPANYIPDEKKDNEQTKIKSQLYSLYSITHLIISFFAIYLSWRCNNGFNILAFLAALCCPYLYIIWALATNGGCGIFDDSSSVYTPTLSTPTYTPTRTFTFRYY